MYIRKCRQCGIEFECRAKNTMYCTYFSQMRKKASDVISWAKRIQIHHAKRDPQEAKRHAMQRLEIKLAMELGIDQSYLPYWKEMCPAYYEKWMQNHLENIPGLEKKQEEAV